jgi:hypothetical protein
MSQIQTDLIHINSSVYKLYSHPLAKYWEVYNNKPSLFSTRSGNTRGYAATWLILNDKLYLIEFWGETIFPKYKEYNLNDLFPKQSQVFADWFTGELSVGVGKQLEDFNVEEYEVKMQVQQGIITSSAIFDKV